MGDVINLTHVRMMRELKRARFLKVYKVEACTKTGEWLTKPEQSGEMVSSFIWARQEDTSEVHYTTFRPDQESDSIAALVVHWT